MYVAERKLLRFRFLKLLYDQTGGDEVECVDDSDIVAILESDGYERQEIERAIRFLEQEHLIAYSTQRQVRFEHEGVKEIESAIEQPNQDTTHFPSNVIVIGTMHGGAIQQGSVSSSQLGTLLGSTHGTVSYSVELSQLQDRLDSLQSEFSAGGWQLTVFPKEYEQNRYETTRDLRNILKYLKGRLISDSLYEIGDTEFGVCSIAIRQSLAMSFSGLLVIRKIYTENQVEYKSPIETGDKSVSLPRGAWLDYGTSINTLGELFHIMHQLRSSLGVELSYELVGTQLLQRYLTSKDPFQYISLVMSPRGPTHTQKFISNGDYAEPWKEECAAALVKLCDKFSHGFITNGQMLDVLAKRFPD